MNLGAQMQNIYVVDRHAWWVLLIIANEIPQVELLYDIKKTDASGLLTDFFSAEVYLFSFQWNMIGCWFQ